MPWRFGLLKRKSDGTLRPYTKYDFAGSVFSLWASSRKDEYAEEELPPGANLDIFLGISIGLGVAIALHKVMPGLTAWNYQSSGSVGTNIFLLLGSTASWLLRIGLVVGLPAAGIYKLLQAEPRFRWVVGPGVAGFYLLAAVLVYGYLHPGQSRSGENAHASEPAPVDSRKVRAEAEAREEAQLQEHDRLVAERNELDHRLAVQWRADVEVAGASDKPGVVPPMLKVVDLRQGAQVTNRLDKPIYVAMARVRHAPDGSLQRCLMDGGNTQLLGPHESRRLQLFRSGNQPACMDGKLEFRVGSVNSPEPSWWTQSALEDYATFLPPVSQSPGASNDDLRAEVASLRARLDESGRADRWRMELHGL